MRIRIIFTEEARKTLGIVGALDQVGVAVLVKAGQPLTVFPNEGRDPDNPDADIYPWDKIVKLEIREGEEEKAARENAEKERIRGQN